MTVNKKPSKEHYEELVTRIYDVVDEYIAYADKEGWNDKNKWILHGMWQLADSVKNQILIAKDVEGLKTSINIEDKINEYENKLKELEIF